MAQSYRATSTTSVPPDYFELKDKTFAVIVSVDRTVEVDFPGLTGEILRRVTERLADPANDAGTSGYVRPIDVVAYLSNNPGWRSKPYGEVAQDLGGVDRLIFIELSEFRLGDPGNEYIWDGVASGTLAVIEADSGLPDDFAYQKSIKVTFPDQVGQTEENMPRQLVTSALLGRFIDRASWPFFTHEERFPEFMKY